MTPYFSKQSSCLRHNDVRNGLNLGWLPPPKDVIISAEYSRSLEAHVGVVSCQSPDDVVSGQQTVASPVTTDQRWERASIDKCPVPEQVVSGADGLLTATRGQPTGNDRQSRRWPHLLRVTWRALRRFETSTPGNEYESWCIRDTYIWAKASARNGRKEL